MCDDRAFKVRIEKIKALAGDDTETFAMLVNRYILQKKEEMPFFIGRPVAA